MPYFFQGVCTVASRNDKSDDFIIPQLFDSMVIDAVDICNALDESLFFDDTCKGFVKNLW